MRTVVNIYIKYDVGWSAKYEFWVVAYDGKLSKCGPGREWKIQAGGLLHLDYIFGTFLFI